MMKISPSILSCDFSRMGEEFARMEKCGADWLHIDVMDGHFVPNLTLGAPIVKALRPYASIPFDVHLMISNPLQYVPDFLKAGADILTFHIESDSPVEETIELVRAGGSVPALSLKPKTPAEAVFPYLDRLGMVLVMTVEPGFGGQSFMEDMMPKVAAIRREATGAAEPRYSGGWRYQRENHCRGGEGRSEYLRGGQRSVRRDGRGGDDCLLARQSGAGSAVIKWPR